MWTNTRVLVPHSKETQDIFQIYLGECIAGYSLGVVISPRGEGAKVLFVRLTYSGKMYLNQLREEAMRRGLDTRGYILQHIPLCQSMKFYYQVPFYVSPEPTTVIDLRDGEKVIRSLNQFIASGSGRYLRDKLDTLFPILKCHFTREKQYFEASKTVKCV